MPWRPFQSDSASWPRDVPSFTILAPAARLLVPLAARLTDATPRPAGTLVSPGESVVEKSSTSSHVPLAAVHGRLGGRRDITLLNGRPTSAVELDPAPTPAEVDAPARLRSPPPVRPGDLGGWIDFLRDAGVWADRRDSPDLIGQLDYALRKPIDTIVCTVLDSDPALRLNAAVAATAAADVVAGVRLLARLTESRRALAAVEAGAPAAWDRALRKAARERDVRVVDLPNDYPQSDPTLMLFTLAGRRLRPGRLPTEKGVILLDAAAAAAVGRCAAGRRPMLTVPLAVLDHGDGRSAFFDVPVGTPLSHVLQACGLFAGPPPADSPDLTLRAGDLLRDVRIAKTAIVAGGDLVVHVARQEPLVNPDPCIRSGWCVQVCPTRAHPALLLEAAQRRDSALAERAGLAACIECGVCSHVCPSKLPLLGAIRGMKGG